MVLFEGVYWLIAVCAAAGAVVGILWIVIQVILLREGNRLRMRATRRNLVELKRLFKNQDNQSLRRIYMLILYMFLACSYAFAASALALFAWFLISALQ